MTSIQESGSASRSSLYTCPMHPEIQSEQPDACPICGMTLEPVTPTLDDDDGGELRDMSRRFMVATILAIPVVTDSGVPRVSPEDSSIATRHKSGLPPRSLKK